MTLLPWEYLFESFNDTNFPDLFHPTWIASAVLLAALAPAQVLGQSALAAGHTRNTRAE